MLDGVGGDETGEFWVVFGPDFALLGTSEISGVLGWLSAVTDWWEWFRELCENEEAIALKGFLKIPRLSWGLEGEDWPLLREPRSGLEARLGSRLASRLLDALESPLLAALLETWRLDSSDVIHSSGPSVGT